MDFVRSRFRRLAALALMLMLGLALVPVLSQARALAVGDSVAMGEVCSTNGLLRTVVAPANSEGDGPARSGHAEVHCPLCTQATSVLGLPPQDRAFTAPKAQQRHDAPSQRRSVPGRAEWARAQPRAPPAMG